MDRPCLRYGHLLAVLTLLATIVPAAGCTGLMAMGLYLAGGMEVPAEYDGLRAKRVVVVCRPVVDEQYRSWGMAKDVGRRIGVLLDKNVRKIEIVDQRKVDEWIDENTWEEYAEIGKALEADLVVGVELSSFSIWQGQTLYQGKADVAINVYDCLNNKLVFEKILPRVVWPPNAGIPAADKPEAAFRRRFARVVSEQVARHFYRHDPRVDVAQTGFD